MIAKLTKIKWLKYLIKRDIKKKFRVTKQDFEHQYLF